MGSVCVMAGPGALALQASRLVICALVRGVVVGMWLPDCDGGCVWEVGSRCQCRRWGAAWGGVVHGVVLS